MNLSLDPVCPGRPAPLLFAVFDGHGGSEVATFAARHMVRSTLSSPEDLKGNTVIKGIVTVRETLKYECPSICCKKVGPKRLTGIFLIWVESLKLRLHLPMIKSASTPISLALNGITVIKDLAPFSSAAARHRPVQL